MSDAPEGDRRMNRTLTQKYDMHALRELQKLETEILQRLGVIFGVDEDDVEVEVDLLKVYNEEESKRKKDLEIMLEKVPTDLVGELVDHILSEMTKLDGTCNK